MRQAILLSGLLWVGLCSIEILPIYGQSVRFSGWVKDSTNHAPIPYATLQIKGTLVGATADENGYFALELSAKTYTFIVRALGFLPVETTVVLKRDTSVVFYLSPTLLQLGQVIVSVPRVESPYPGIYRLTAQTVKNSPSIAEPDVVRALARAPGIYQLSDVRPSLYVRGGAADQNQFLLDGIEIFNPSHLLGTISPFNVETIGAVETYAGIFPARYGNRLSSVILLKPDFFVNKKQWKANLSLLASTFTFKQRWKKAGLVVGVRRTYMELALALLQAPFTYSFYDISGHYFRQLAPRWRVRFTLYTNRDGMSAGNAPNNDGPIRDGKARWGNRAGGITLAYKGQRVKHQFRGAVTQFKVAMRGRDFFIDNTLYKWESGYEGLLAMDPHRIVLGIGGQHFSFRNAWNVVDGVALDEVFYPEAPPFLDYRRKLSLFTVYVEPRIILTPVWYVEVGMRYEALPGFRGGYFSPRIFSAYQLKPEFLLTAGIGRQYQFFARGKEGKEFSLYGPLFVLERPQEAWTYTVGIDWKREPYDIRIEGYGRVFISLATLKRTLPSLYPAFNQSPGKAYGIEVSLRKTKGWIRYELAYTFSRVFYKQSGRFYPADWDLPHVLEGVIGFQVAHYWRLNIAGMVRSGLPFTAARGQFLGVVDYRSRHRTFIPGVPNRHRAPLYHRIDISLRRQYENNWFFWDLYVQVMNVFNVQNYARTEDWYRIYQPGFREAHVQPNALPFLPSFGIELTFK